MTEEQNAGPSELQAIAEEVSPGPYKSRRILHGYIWSWRISVIALIAVTFQLWSPANSMPKIPFFTFLVNLPPWVDGFAAIGLLLSVVLVGWYPERWHGTALVMLLVSMMASIALDQHRLQPWAYQFILIAIVLVGLPRRSAIHVFRWIAISIYVYSAISKLDYQFALTTGQEMLSVVISWSGVEADQLDAGLATRIALGFPLFELLAALLLMSARTRRAGAIAVMMMHLMLLVILGPLGMQQQLGVLVWNLFLLVQAWYLFWSRDDTPEVARPQVPMSRWSLLRFPAAWIIGLALVLPATAGIGVWDHWPSWEVYAPRSSRAELRVAPNQINRLPDSLRQLLNTKSVSRNGLNGALVPLDRWSIEQRNVPIYPEDRYQFALAVAVVQRYGITDFEIYVGGISNRWTGRRNWKRLRRMDEISRTRDDFRLNTFATDWNDR